MLGPESDALGITVEQLHSGVVLSVSGEVDIVTAPRLQCELENVLADDPVLLLIDLSAVTFLASVGLSVLASAKQRAQPTTRVAVVASGPVTARPIELTGLDNVLDMHPTRAEALRVG